MAEEKKEKIRAYTPVGRVTNHSVFEKDVYKDEKGREGTPRYTIEMAFEPGDIEELENAVVEAVVQEWGAAAEDEYFDGKIEGPFRNGDELAENREKKGKVGDVYKGMEVIRAHTVFNKDQVDGPGGIYVCDENAVEIGFADRNNFYRGCYAVANVTMNPYLINGKRGVSLYVNGVQFIKDGERLRGSDPSSLFKPQMGSGSEEGKGRKRRGK